MQENRKRNKQIKFRLTEEEYILLKNKISKSGLNQETFLREIIKNTKVITPPPVDYYKYINALNKQTTELKRLGNNLNQIAVKLNSNQDVDEELIYSTLLSINNYITYLSDKQENDLWQ